MKILGIFLLCSAFLFVGCTQTPDLDKKKDSERQAVTVDAGIEDEKYNEMVSKAIKTLENKWKEIYNDPEDAMYEKTDGYFEIKNVRVVEIKENNVELFENVEYIVEFILFSDYFAYEPDYYFDAQMYNSVVVYEGGTMEVEQKNFFRVHVSKTYDADLSDIIQSITDLGDQYNCVNYLK